MKSSTSIEPLLAAHPGMRERRDFFRPEDVQNNRTGSNRRRLEPSSCEYFSSFVPVLPTLRERRPSDGSPMQLDPADESATDATAATRDNAPGERAALIASAFTDLASSVDDGDHGDLFEHLAGHLLALTSVSSVVVRLPDADGPQRCDSVPGQSDRSADSVNARVIPIERSGLVLGHVEMAFTPSTGLSEVDLQLAQALVAVAATVARQRHLLRDATQVSAQLEWAIGSRDEVEQAKGMVSAARQIPVEEAFGYIRDHARRTNSKISAVAQLIVDRKLEV